MKPLLLTGDDVGLPDKPCVSAEAMAQWVLAGSPVAASSLQGVYIWDDREQSLVIVDDVALASVPAKHILAQDENTSPEALRFLSYDTSDWVISSVVENKSTPEDVLIRMSEECEPHIRNVIAESISTPASVLVAMAKRSKSLDVAIPSRLAKNPNTPVDALRKLATFRSDRVREAVKRHPNVTPDVVALVESYKKK